MKTLLYIASFVGSLASVNAQIPVSPGETYSQNFDSLANTGTAGLAWTQNTTLPGWYAYGQTLGTLTSYNPTTGPASDGIASFGLNGQTDRSLGTGLSLGVGNFIYFGARFSNISSSAINSVSVTYDGEQWYRSSNVAGSSDSLVVDYQVFSSGAGSISAAIGWTSVPALTFTSPVNSGVASFESLNGNLPANRTAGITGVLTSLAIDPGQELWIRWTATNLPQFSDYSLAVDNLNVSFGSIPEPASYAAVMGFVVAAKCMLTRRRKTERGSRYHPIL